MKYISFFHKQDDIRNIKVGILDDKQNVYDLSPIFPDILAIINTPDSIDIIQSYLEKNKDFIHLSDVSLTAPITKPIRNIFCVGWNYLEHFEERHNKDIDLPKKPTFFTKGTNTIAGPYEDIPTLASFTSKLDYEAELAVVIGKEGINIKPENALEYVFGYMCANDITARDVQFDHGGQWFKGKSMDKSCPVGPYILSKNEISNPHNLSITCTVNNTIVQSSNTGLMNFSIEQIISELSCGMTLLPGDIILTGTPSGIGSKRTPPLFLKKNDIVVVTISELGEIRNLIC